jgi:endogenous inhibitor of DNA gyrase (YacG/DUF329 family)
MGVDSNLSRETVPAQVPEYEDGMNAIDIDEAPAERRCANCLDPVVQTRIDGEEDEFCGQHCADAWLAWWMAAKAVQT